MPTAEASLVTLLVKLGVVASLASILTRFSGAKRMLLREQRTLRQRLRFSAWFAAIFGALLAPLVEEIAFRGFLLPAVATAYDWVSLDRTPAAYNRWRQTTSHTAPALVLAALISSAAFAALHGSQLHWAHGPIFILFCVALVLSWVRIRFHSVAASALVHISYNGILFLILIIATSGFHHLDKITN